MKTTPLLFLEFECADIPLDVVAAKYLGMASKAAANKAAKGELPFPAYRRGSQKSPWLVRISDLATWLDAERAKAQRDFDGRMVA